MSIFDRMTENFKKNESTEYSLDQYLTMCKEDPSHYDSPAERMLKAIGEPTLVDTSKDSRLSRIFANRTVRIYPAFKDFYGMEDVIERIVGYFKHSAQGLEEQKQVLYLLGPVGTAKSSLANTLKSLMEKNPFYALKFENEISPVYECPFGLFKALGMSDQLTEDYNIPYSLINRSLLSPWGVKRLNQSKGDFSKFKVIKIYPNELTQQAITKTEPADENNSDISSLVGKVDIRKLEKFSQNDTDAYGYSGALNRANQGMVEFIEIWKAPIKSLHPLLTATQEGNYCGTEAIGAIPFKGIILAHSNESEWQTFKNNKNNEAFLDRVCVIKVPYCLRVDEEKKIYEKMVERSGLAKSPCAPQTMDILAQFSILTRLRVHENSNLFSKMRVYNGENIRESDPKAKSKQEYTDTAGVDEGMDGISTRFAYKILSQTFNFSTDEVAADPVHLMYVMENTIKREQFDTEREQTYLNFIKSELAPRYAEFLGNVIQRAYIESYGEYGQNLFVRYLSYADSWIQNTDYVDPDNGLLMDRAMLNAELEKIEKPAGIANPKDFRNEVVNFCLRAKAKNGKEVQWNSYSVMRDVIEKRMFSKIEELLPVISFDSKKDKELEKKHKDFVSRMVGLGYTEKQIRRLCDWYQRVRKSA